MRWVDERLSQETPVPAITCSAVEGRRLLAVDGSVIREPGAITSTWCLHFAMNIGTLSCHAIR